MPRWLRFAARAKEKLPQAVNGRIERAVKLVLMHDVTPQADGTIEVGSSTDPLKTYRLEGPTCTCQDYTHGKAPEGWCAHRIAAGIAKRVQELMRQPAPAPVVPEVVEPWPDNNVEDAPPPAVEPVPAQPPGHGAQEPVQPSLPEAPASVNCHITIAGRQVQLTLRDTDEARLLQRLAAVLAQYPTPQPAQAASQPQLSPQQHNALAMHKRVTDVCPVHGAKKPSTKGTGWYCPHKLEDGTWCKGQ